MGNPTQMHQIFMNLYTNAVHAMDQDGGILTVGLSETVLGSPPGQAIAGLDPGKYLKIIVSDTGKGIPAEQIDLIFEPYFTTKGREKGTGLGLSVVHGIIKTYGGEITVASRPGEGTAFEIYLPILEQSAAGLPADPAFVPTGKERILFVDDELPIAELNKQLLERLGYRVTTRTNSIEALELFKFRKNDFDLVITDMMMPYMTGDKLALRLHQMRPDIPIILSTGYSEQIANKQASDIGVSAIIMKPISKSDLAQTIRKVLDGEKDSISEQNTSPR
jgi:CheY-like chemotaxis protein